MSNFLLLSGVSFIDFDVQREQYIIAFQLMENLMELHIRNKYISQKISCSWREHSADKVYFNGT